MASDNLPDILNRRLRVKGKSHDPSKIFAYVVNGTYGGFYLNILLPKVSQNTFKLKGRLGVCDLYFGSLGMYDCGLTFGDHASDGTLLGDTGTVFNTLTGKLYMKRGREVSTIEFHKGKLYTSAIIEEKELDKSLSKLTGGEYYHCYSYNDVFEMASGTKISRQDNQYSQHDAKLCSHNGRLFQTGGCHSGIIRDVFTGEILSELRKWIHTMHSHEGKLYCGLAGAVVEAETGKIVAKRKGHIVDCLTSYDGQLCDGGDYGIYKSMTDELFITVNELVTMSGME